MALTLNDITSTSNPNSGSLKQRLARYLLGEIVGYDDQGVMNDPSKVYDSQTILNAANKAISEGTPVEAAKKAATKTLMEGKRISPFIGENVNLDKVGVGNWAKLAGTAAIKHPFKTMGLIGLGAGNIGGLTDNDKFGGQLGGLALGGLGAHALAAGNPYVAAMMTMGGGALGSLFDKLRAQREQEQNYYK